MPSRPFDSGWDFGPVLDLIDSDSHVGSPLRNEQAAPSLVSQEKNLQERTSRQSLRLGNFGKLFAELGISDVGPVAPISPVEPDSEDLSSSSDGLFAPSSASPKKVSPTKKKAAQHAGDLIKATDLMLNPSTLEDDMPQSPTKSSDNSTLAGLSKKQRKRARKRMLENELENKPEPVGKPEGSVDDLPQANKARPTLILPKDSTASKNSGRHESETKLPSRTPSRSNVSAKIQPATPPISGPFRPKVDRNFHFLNQLLANFPGDLEWLVSPMQLCNESRATQGIHVFVDASNILIGFQWAMKKYRVAPFDISFDSLALLMERRRPVAKRVFAGSHREANPLPYVQKLQEVSRAVGYENTIKEQVFICREETERKRFFKDVEKMGFQKAVEKSKRGTGSGSDSETGTAAAAPLTPSAPKWVEQGVDEILHLKMCQSIIDTEVPTTMVLATGDGAEAEHSDGFLAHVERALKKGWKIELVSWKQQTNGGYRNKKFRAKWGDQFKIIELDDYLEALIDTQ
ncbi:hypothetical protein DM02DRAFT_533509 [Periconia macrospinosa]|uniref:NYN domain-containing protein n=1 Tax=Periconia macrospinosa TaxID=97972 RepID=A0A2V1DGV4_9PLEO|nr:hypothetical protein DM02DRAFT_533509 [Periconia macrospinosa]